jgi:hypothetical protein
MDVDQMGLSLGTREYHNRSHRGSVEAVHSKGFQSKWIKLDTARLVGRNTSTDI